MMRIIRRAISIMTKVVIFCVAAVIMTKILAFIAAKISIAVAVIASLKILFLHFCRSFLFPFDNETNCVYNGKL